MVNEELEQLISDGIRFLESITRYYGIDRGMEVWNAMGEAVGKEVKGKIFFAMISGASNAEVSFRVGTADTSGNAVNVIKTVRSYTGMGLKEAKDLWDHSKGYVSVVKVSPDDVRKLRDDLRNFGCLVF